MADSTHKQTPVELPDPEKERLIREAFDYITNIATRMKSEENPIAKYWKNVTDDVTKGSIGHFFVQYCHANWTMYGVVGSDERQKSFTNLKVMAWDCLTHAINEHRQRRGTWSTVPVRSESPAASIRSQGSSIGSDMMFRMDKLSDDGKA